MIYKKLDNRVSGLCFTLSTFITVMFITYTPRIRSNNLKSLHTTSCICSDRQHTLHTKHFKKSCNYKFNNTLLIKFFIIIILIIDIESVPYVVIIQ
jgi:hypothetical protein